MIQSWKNPVDVTFLTFADSTFATARDRIKREALHSGFFSRLMAFSETDLPENLRAFCERNKHIDRGYGCYIWKSYVVSTVAELPDLDGQIVFWIDSGTWINRFGVTVFKRYLAALTDEKPFVVFERLDHKETYSTKRGVFHALDAYAYVDTHPIMAGIFGFKVNALSRSVLAAWRNTCLTNPKLLDQSPCDAGPEFPGHQANRHDQGIFSLLLKKQGCHTTFSAEHILPELHDSYLEMAAYPFVAMRDRSAVVLENG